MRAFARRRVLPIPALLPHHSIPLLLGIDELLSRVPVITARAPVTGSRTALPLGCARGLLRLPQLSARELFHLRVGMFLLDALKSRQQFFAVRRAESSRKPARNNRPVRITRRHVGSL